MQLKQIIDPRDGLQKARRTDIIRFAKANGITEIHPEMQGETMKAILRDKGINKVPIANPQQLGAGHKRQTEKMPPLQQTVDVEDLQRQINELTTLLKAKEVAAHLEKEVAEAKTKSVNEITQLRQECKARGIKMARTDKIADLRAKLNGTSKPS